MDEMTDPNSIDFEEQALTLARQRKLAERLRKQAMASETPEGQMVSGRYVRAPLLAGGINNAFKQYEAGRAERQLAGAEDLAGRQNAGAMRNWQSQLPQARAATPELAGPPAEYGSPDLEAQPAQAPNEGQVLKATMAGMRIPGNEKSAELWNKGMMGMLDREDKQKAKADESRLARIAKNEQLITQGNQKLDQIRLMAQGNLSPDQKIQLKKMEDATKRYVAELQAQSKVDAAESRATAAGAKVKPVPNTVVKSLNDAEGTSQGLADSYTTFKPQYGGAEGAIDKFSGTWNPLSGPESEETANWWKDYNKQSALVERHEKFGSTLNAGERAAWRDATISPGMKAGVIANNLKTRAKLAAKFYNELRRKYATVGYPQVEDAFEPHPEDFETIPGQTETPIQAPSRQIAPTGVPTQRVNPRSAPVVAPPSGGKPALRFNPATGTLEKIGG